MGRYVGEHDRQDCRVLQPAEGLDARELVGAEPERSPFDLLGSILVSVVLVGAGLLILEGRQSLAAPAIALFAVALAALAALLMRRELAHPDPVINPRLFRNRAFTAATSGVGFRHLVRKNAETVGLFGSGGQAANQLLALATERPIRRVRVYSRDPDNRRRFAETYGAKLGLDIAPVDTPEDVVRGVDVVLCATNTHVVLFDGDRLEPGQHVTGIIGSNIQLVKGGFLNRRRREIDDRTAERADVIAVNLRESVITEEQGDLFEPIERGLISIDDVAELGELAAGTRDGRARDDQITYHKNNNGTGASEMALAMRAYVLAKADGRGTEIDVVPAQGS